MSGESIHDIVQRVLGSVGVNPVSYGAHSLRAGLITAASERGVGEAAIMARSGHRSLATVISYIRPANVFRTDPLARVL